MPPANEFKGYYALIVEILNDLLTLSTNIADGGVRLSRLAKMEDLHKTVESVHGDYLHLFDCFSINLRHIRNLITDNRQNNGEELLDQAIREFRESCLARRQDRAESKSIATVYVASALDVDEAKYLTAVFFYFQHNFELGQTNIFMQDVEMAFERGTSLNFESAFDTAGTYIDERISAIHEPTDIRKRIDDILQLVHETDRALNHRLGEILRYHQNLRRAWRLTALAHDRKSR